MLKDKTQAELNQRVNDELYAWYLYTSMAAYFTTINLLGFAQWMKAQAKEEMTHAMKNFEHIIERGGVVSLKTVEAPPAKWDSPLAAVQAAYDHEVKVTAIYHRFMEMALTDKDYATVEFLNWFIKEQVEEEAQTLDIVQKLKMTNNSAGGVMVLDHHLGKRV